MDSRLDDIALSFLPFSLWRTIAEHLRSGCSSADVLLLCGDRVSRRTDKRGPAGPSTARELAAVSLERAARARIQAVCLMNALYPAALKEIADPPPVLWAAGNLTQLGRPSVALVGSRAGSLYAVTVAERLAADLSARGLVVISGLARGVDAAAHRGALAVGGATVGVLGCGVDVVYPPEHASLVAEVTSTGAVVSELAPGTAPRPAFFPRRNRLISGLARAVVVVEAGEKSGSLITARCALEQGRDVLAVPGNILTGRNKGGHALLRDGARIVESADDILEELGTNGVGASPWRQVDSADPVLNSLQPGEPTDLDGITERTGMPVAELLPRLLELEIRGLLRREPGGRFFRPERNVLG